MKKLIMVLAGIALAVSANAATTSWKFTAASMKGCNLTSSYSGNVLIYAAGGDLSESTLVATLSTTTGTISGKEFTTDLLTSEQTYSFTYVLADSKDSVDYTLTSIAKSVKALGTGSATLGWGNQSSYTATKSNWVAAPEPTSALLMLLGMAGLALKRKRA